MKHRIIWNTETKSVIAVVPDESGTITNYPQLNHEHAVIASLDTIKSILVSQGYNVGRIDEYILGDFTEIEQ